jgi:hypothetical protein
MKLFLELKALISCIFLLLVFSGCEKRELPEVVTAEISSIDRISAISGGEGTNEGTSEVISKGVCWSGVDNPTIGDSITVDGSGLGSFTSNLTGLNPETDYFVRAYATNNEGTGYGETKSFATDPASVPETNALITSVTLTTATTEAEIVADGGSQIIDRGFCWNTKGYPTLSDNFVSLGAESDTFSTTLTNLEPNTCYYLRAYATNLAGTGYSSNMLFATPFPDNPIYSVDSLLGSWEWIYSIGGMIGGIQAPYGNIIISEYKTDSVFVESSNDVKFRECNFSVSGNTLKYSDMKFFYRIKIRGDNLHIVIIDTLGISIPLDYSGSYYYKRFR